MRAIFLAILAIASFAIAKESLQPGKNIIQKNTFVLVNIMYIIVFFIYRLNVNK